MRTVHFYTKTVYPFFSSFIVQLCVYDFFSTQSFKTHRYISSGYLAVRILFKKKWIYYY